jgi:hypothetical protein
LPHATIAEKRTIPSAKVVLLRTGDRLKLVTTGDLYFTSVGRLVDRQSFAVLRSSGVAVAHAVISAVLFGLRALTLKITVVDASASRKMSNPLFGMTTLPRNVLRGGGLRLPVFFMNRSMWTKLGAPLLVTSTVHVLRERCSMGVGQKRPVTAASPAAQSAG